MINELCSKWLACKAIQFTGSFDKKMAVFEQSINFYKCQRLRDIGGKMFRSCVHGRRKRVYSMTKYQSLGNHL
jgi:hypothetical protein